MLGAVADETVKTVCRPPETSVSIMSPRQALMLPANAPGLIPTEMEEAPIADLAPPTALAPVPPGSIFQGGRGAD